ncbi:MAG: adenylate/guanylate cyclase domain-containing protein [Planctomycetales bacterium]|nr:adenylate/guanylate cyclase domain-containing protein [Planctomycetales bacterium]
MQLTAVGPDGQQTQIDLVEATVMRFGRAPKSGWAIPWDLRISREHADIQWTDGRLKVNCTAGAAHAIIYDGRLQREINVGLGETFRIGTTEFRMPPPRQASDAPLAVASHTLNTPQSNQVTLDASDGDSVHLKINDSQKPQDQPEIELAEVADDVEEHSYAADVLKHTQFADPKRQMELLANLPRMITTAESDVELAVKLVGLLLDAIPQAVAVAVVQYDESVVTQLKQSTSEQPDLPMPALMRVQTRATYEGRFVPSRRLLCRALKRTESNMHIWAGEAGGTELTMSGSLNWAFCTPIAAESCTGWCLYVSGEGGNDGKSLVSEDDLKGDLRFTELLAQFIGSIRQVRLLQEQKTQLSSFFSPKVIQSLTGRSATDVLKPSEREITVMFCDVRGFSKKAEQYRDNLQELLKCVRAALSSMTGGIIDNDGTIADFQGDAALGFWGWPVALEEGPIPACLAALAVRAEFNRMPEEQGLLEGFSVGVGIAHGRAIAGQIGTRQQAKVGVFGPVVNQGSRLEGLTNQFGIGICVDEATADFVRRLLPRKKGRIRKLACVRPKGMDTAIIVSELLPPFGHLSKVTDAMIERHEAAVAAIIAGRWTEALAILEALSSSGPKQFLLDHMAESDSRPPLDWTGSFSLTQK